MHETLDHYQKAVMAFLQARPSMHEFNRASDSLEINIALEAAEILELTKIRSIFTDREYKNRLGSEMADVLWYLLTLAEMQDIDLGKSLMDKIRTNEQRFPAEHFQGSGDQFLDQYWERKKLNGERN